MPTPAVERLQRDGARYGVSVVGTEPACHALHFAYGLRLPPVLRKLIEEPAAPRSMAATGIDRADLSTWTDLHAHALGVEQGVALAPAAERVARGFALRHGDHFSILASGYSPTPRGGPRAEHAVKQLAPLAPSPDHVEGTTSASALDEYWAAAVELGVPSSHPVQPTPTPAPAHRDDQVVQSRGTTLCVGR